MTGRFTPAFRCAKYQLPRKLARRDAELRAEAEAIFTRGGAAMVDEKQRVAAAEAIGVAGDARIAAGRVVENLLPTDGPLRLGRYPVTVEEYARFVDDGGYTREELWVDDDVWSFRTRVLAVATVDGRCGVQMHAERRHRQGRSGHGLARRSQVLEVGTDDPRDQAEYPDIDLRATPEGYVHRDGAPYPRREG